MCLFKEPFEPDLIDLVKYEKDAKLGRPAPTIAGLIGRNWTDEEMKVMRENREEAKKIYDKYN
jgi:hypothetical protein